MRGIRAWLLRLAGIFRKDRRDGELADELEAHLQMHVDDNIRAGMTSEEARRQGLIALGGVEQTKEVIRERRGLGWIDSLIQDTRFALRMLRKNPGFTAVAVLTLALGIGANTAIFSVVQAALLAPLPYQNPERLVAVLESNPRFPQVLVSYPNFKDKQRESVSFERMAAFAPKVSDLTAPGRPEHLDGEAVSAGAFSTLGVQLALGREFSAAEDTQGGMPAAVISDRLWRDRFAGAGDVLGKSITLNGADHTVVGVLPADFRFWDNADVYTPLGQGDPALLNARASHWIFSIGRLKPGVTMSQAQAELGGIQDRLDKAYPDDDRDLGIAVAPLKRLLVGDSGRILLLLLSAVALVLMIACANLASLSLARSAGRSSEFAIRSALGANRARIIRQSLTESILLSLVGGALGVLVAVSCMRPLLALLPATLAGGESSRLSAPVFCFAFAVSIAAAILFGIGPALSNSGSHLHDSLADRTRSIARGRHGVQNALVIFQVALTLVLLAGAGLLFRTIRNLSEVSLGFETQNLITFKIGALKSPNRTAAATRIAYQQLSERIRQIPGVRAAEFSDTVPLAGNTGTLPFWIGSSKPASVQAAPRLVAFLAGPDYLRTMGIRLIRGRFFTLDDTTGTPCVVAIDNDFARMYFQNSDPIGQIIMFGFAATPPCRIVGIVGHIKESGLEDAPTHVQTQLYFPLYQDPDQWVAENYSHLSVVVRTTLDATSLMPTVQLAIHDAGDDEPVYDVRTMEQVVSGSMSSQRFPMILLAAFAGLALILASLGIYGVISYSVAERTNEIGLRMALGAERYEVFRMIIGQGMRLTFIGFAIGVVAAVSLTRLLSSFSQLLYGVSASDPVTFAVVILLLAGISSFACYVPARRAMRVDPMVALRHE
jgi:predicted permease